MKLTNIILPTQPNNNVQRPSTTGSNQNTTYDITISDSIITSIVPHSHSTSHTIPSSTSSSVSAQPPCPPPSLLLPTLTHPHIHLDKAYLLTSNATHPLANPPCCHSANTLSNLPDYAPLSPKTGEFKEALTLTSQAKQLYTADDLYLRGKQLLLTSYRQGVTAARCFVEVDHVTGEKCVDVGRRLKEEFEGVVFASRGAEGSGHEVRPGDESESGSKRRRVKVMRVQLVAFAQDPIFSTEHGEENRTLLEEVLEKYKDDGVIEVLGTTPYVETSRTASLQNIQWAITTALKYNLHLDFHLDYNLNPSVTKNPSELMVWDVIHLLKEHNWPTRTSQAPPSPPSPSTAPASIPKPKPKPKQKTTTKTVMLGHCTALTLLTHSSLTRLSTTIHTSNLPIYFVSLPTSDIYMQGRPTITATTSSKNPPQPSVTLAEATPLHRPRATLNIISLIKHYGIKTCLGVNNVGNAFTPFGTGDLIELAAWGVGLYQRGGEGDAEVLYSCVSFGAREACGLEGEDCVSLDGDGDADGNRNVTATEYGKVARDADEEEVNATEKEKETFEKFRRSMGVARDVNAGFEVYEGMNLSAFGLLQIQNEDSINIQDSDRGWEMSVPARKRVSLRDVLWDVPEVRLRRVIR